MWALIGVPATAGAQYFGRNKVEYRDFDFRILATRHFDIYYYAAEEPAARLAASMAERWYTRLSTVLQHELDRRQPLVVYGSQAEFAQTNVVSGLISDSIGGVTEAQRRRIVLPFAPTMAETNHVLGHEIVHAFQFDIARRIGADTAQPLWFIEGMAEYLSRGGLDADSTLWLRDAVLTDRIPKRQKDAAAHLSPYQFGHAFWAYLSQRFGDQIFEKVLKPGKKQHRLNDRMLYATGHDLDALYEGWRSSVQWMADRPQAEPLPRLIAGSMQLGPALSPDGRQAVFFSERDRLSLDLYLADAKSGQVVRRLATMTASGRFDSLQPLRSAGAWSPDGAWFAFPAVRHGAATLMLIDMSGSGGDREIPFASLGQVLSPAFSPDGKSIVFSALAGGFTDLYVCDVGTGALRRLTSDAFADLQPAWSHDGRTIAFATERYSSDLETLHFGSTTLAVLDIESNRIRPLDAAIAGSQINPQWSADDRELWFVGGSDGIANVFRVALDGSGLRQITDVDTGVNSITPTSPALSLSHDASTLAFTIYTRGRPQLVVLDPSTREPITAAAAPRDVSDDTTDGSAPVRGIVDRQLSDDRTGLPDPGEVNAHAYSSKLSLEGVGQPYLSAGGGPYGNTVRGGGALFFGDMLSQRRLGAAVQLANHRRDAAFEFRFLNQARRWNWGAVAQLEPGLGRQLQSEVTDVDGQPAVLKQADYLHRVQLYAGGIVAYLFNRSLRVEFGGGVRAAAYQRELRTQVSSSVTGHILSKGIVESSGGLPTKVGELSAAIVHDTAMFGATGPILGSRFRFEVTPAAGDLTYTRVLADYRRYLMPIRPYTVAVRVMHSARYGVDANDARLLPSFLGSDYLVRGHRYDVSYCRPESARLCGDDLLGSRLLVGNLEVRVPVWGIRSRQIEYGPVPADIFLFADGGLVGSGDGRSTHISSVGGGFRVNAAGLPLEVAAIRSVDGPSPRWQFDIGFRVGF